MKNTFTVVISMKNKSEALMYQTVINIKVLVLKINRINYYYYYYLL